MAAMSRKLVWIEQQRFRGFGCSECDWRFKSPSALTGTSFDEIMRNFELQPARQRVYIACLRRSPQDPKAQTVNNSRPSAPDSRQSRYPPKAEKWGRDNLPAKRPPWPQRLLSFAGLRFHGLRRGKFPVSVWLGAQGTRMQLTRFLGRRTTSRTRHGKYLFQREFLGFHHHIMQPSAA